MAPKASQYIDLQGGVYALSGLDNEERTLIEKLKAYARKRPKWYSYSNLWTAQVEQLYAPRGLSRRQMIETIVYRVGQDLGSRLAIAQGQARRSDYRDELEQLILTKFKTRREFCRATGLSEDMLSHVLARRKHLAVDTLNTALEKVGYTLRIRPLSQAQT